ncbi:MAG: VTT domain-containing protein [Erysipelotrichales bacterium]
MIFKNDIAATIQKYLDMMIVFVEQFGFIGAMLMSFLEAIFPSLPLVAIAGINTKNYGMLGFVFTYVGSVVGMLVVFYVIRFFITSRFQNSKFFNKSKGFKKYLDWIERKGFTSVMILMCFPFIPTSILNYSCALSKMPKREFLVIAIVSRFISIAFLSYFGASLLDFIKSPMKAIIAVVIMIVVYIFSKYLEKRIDTSEEAK